MIGNEHDVVLTDLEKNTAKEEFLQRNIPSEQNTPREGETEKKQEEGDTEDQNLLNEGEQAIDSENLEDTTKLEVKYFLKNLTKN